MYNLKITHQKLTLVLFAALFCAFSSPCRAQQPDDPKSLSQAAQEIQKLYGELSSLTFDFTQVTLANARKRTGLGNAVFYRFTPKDLSQRVSIMRWNYRKPDTQVIINNGETISIYTERDKQMLITPATELESDITYRLLAGNQNVLNDFTIDSGEMPEVPEQGKDTGWNLQTMRLTPKEPHSQVKAVLIWFDKHYLIHRIIIEDHFDSVTDLHFTNISLNSLPANDQQSYKNIVDFSPPADTEIISQ